MIALAMARYELTTKSRLEGRPELSNADLLELEGPGVGAAPGGARPGEVGRRGGGGARPKQAVNTCEG